MEIGIFGRNEPKMSNNGRNSKFNCARHFPVRKIAWCFRHLRPKKQQITARHIICRCSRHKWNQKGALLGCKSHMVCDILLHAMQVRCRMSDHARKWGNSLQDKVIKTRWISRRRHAGPGRLLILLCICINCIKRPPATSFHASDLCSCIQDMVAGNSGSFCECFFFLFSQAKLGGLVHLVCCVIQRIQGCLKVLPCWLKLSQNDLKIIQNLASAFEKICFFNMETFNAPLEFLLRGPQVLRQRLLLWCKIK